MCTKSRHYHAWHHHPHHQKVHFAALVLYLSLVGTVIFNTIGFPHFTKAAQSFYAGWNTDTSADDPAGLAGAQDASTAPPDMAGVGAPNWRTPPDNTANSLKFSPGQTLYYPIGSNLSSKKGSIEAKFQLPMALNASDQSKGIFNQPNGVFVSGNDLYVADTSNNRLVKTDMTGSSWSTIGGSYASGSGAGQLNAPNATYYDSDSGYIYIADGSNNRIVKTKLDGSEWHSYSGTGGTYNFNCPTGVFYDTATQYVYALDKNNSRIVRFKWNGDIVSDWDSFSSSTTQGVTSSFLVPLAFTYVDGYFYVANSTNGPAIVRTQWGGANWSTYGVVSDFGNFPAGIAYDSSGQYLYVSDGTNNRIARLHWNNSSWDPIEWFGTLGRSNTQFNRPCGLFFNNGYLYVTDSYNGRIVKTVWGSPSEQSYGTQSTYSGQFDNPSGLTSDANGNLFVVDNTNKRIVVTKTDGSVWGVVGGSIVGSNTSVGSFNNPLGIWYDSATEYIYVADAGDHRIVRFKWDNDNKVYTNWDTWGTFGVGGVAGTFSTPRAVTTDETGILYVVDSTNKLIRSSWKNALSDWNWSAINVNSTNLSGAYGIAYDAAGIVYIADTGNNRIVRVHWTGAGYDTLYQSPGNGSTVVFNQPRGIAFDHASSTAYVTNYNSYSIVKGVWSGAAFDAPSWASFGSSGLGPGNFTKPYGIVYSASNSKLYIVDTNSMTVTANRIIETGWNAANWVAYYGKNTKTLLRTSGPNPLWIFVDYMTNNFKFYVSNGNNKLNYYVATTPITIGLTDVVSDNWHSLKATYNYQTGVVDISIDGAVLGAATYSPWSEISPSAWGTNFYVGSNSTVGTLGGNAQTVWGGLLDELKISSFVDNVPPSNPTSVNGFTSFSKTDSLASSDSDWYAFSAPYFEWNKPADTGDPASGIDGYYVYFGTGNPATVDPVTDGTYITTESFTAHPSATGTYHLLVKTKDKDGNINAASANLFTYKYDVTLPTNPAYVTASPSSFTSINTYTFFWPDGSDADSRLKGYEYRVKKADGSYVSDWVSTNDKSVIITDQATAGTNVFYLRAVDNVGNKANPISTNFLFAGAAPNPPSMSEEDVTPQTDASHPSETNSFSFKWTPPVIEDGLPAINHYLYAVNPSNSIMSNSNTTVVPGGASATSVGNIHATQQGENKFCIATVGDGDNNVNFDNKTCVSFYVQTPVPGVPVSVNPFDISNRDTSEYAVTIKWTAPVDKGLGFKGYEVYRSTDKSNWQSIGETSGTAYVDSDSNMSSQLYYYKVRSKDDAERYSDDSTIVSIIPTGKFSKAPKLKSNSLSVANKTYSASISWETQDDDSRIVHKARAYVEFGPDLNHLGTQNGGDTAPDRTLADQHNIVIKGLRPGGEKYYYRLIWEDEDGNMGSYTSPTPIVTLPRPTVSNLTYTNVGLHSITISYETSIPATTEISYGTAPEALNTKYTVPGGGLTTKHIINLGNDDKPLTHSTQYYFTVKGEDADGNMLDIGTTEKFQTLTMPKIEGVVAVDQNKDAPTTTYRFSWKTNVETNTVVYYQSNSGQKLSKSLPDYTLDHQIEVPNLADMSTYNFQVTGVDRNGISVETPFVQDIATPKDSRPPKVSNLTIEVKSSGFGTTQKAQIVVTWETDEPSTSQVEYEQGISGNEYKNKSKVDAAYSTSHVVILSELEPSQIYHLRALSADAAGNVGRSDDTTTITGKMQNSVLDIIINSLERSLGWIFTAFKFNR